MTEAIWHDLECGGYDRDLPLWLELARTYGGPVLDIGAGTGRVALDLARAGHSVVALDRDAELAASLRERAADLPVRVVEADARAFALGERFPLCVVPMQTVQLLGGAAGRARFFSCASAHLAPGGTLALAIADRLEIFEVGPTEPGPLPDMAEHDGVLYASTPTAVRREGAGFVLERRREIVDSRGTRTVRMDRIGLDVVDAPGLVGEGARAGLRSRGIRRIPATPEYVGSTVVMFSA